MMPQIVEEQAHFPFVVTTAD